jgi:hypothetical protein
MKGSMKAGAVLAGGIAASAAGAVAIGRAIWRRETERAVERLDAAARAGPSPRTGRFSPDELTALPPCAARYFEFALAPGQPLIRRARVAQEGDFLLPAAGWRPFAAVEHFSVRPPGFVWDATIGMAPLVPVHVRDSYLDGEGRTSGKAAALVPLVDQHGGREMASASLLRHLAESPWFPTALLPSAGVSWAPRDDHTARATLADGSVTVWADFSFGSDGEVIGVAALRYRTVDGRQVPTPWSGRFWDYERVHGMMVPRRGEVGWVLPEGRQPYWRGRVTELDYEPTPAEHGGRV